ASHGSLTGASISGPTRYSKDHLRALCPESLPLENRRRFPMNLLPSTRWCRGTGTYQPSWEPASNDWTGVPWTLFLAKYIAESYALREADSSRNSSQAEKRGPPERRVAQASSKKRLKAA